MHSCKCDKEKQMCADPWEKSSSTLGVFVLGPILILEINAFRLPLRNPRSPCSSLSLVKTFSKGNHTVDNITWHLHAWARKDCSANSVIYILLFRLSGAPLGAFLAWPAKGMEFALVFFIFFTFNLTLFQWNVTTRGSVQNLLRLELFAPVLFALL